MNVKCSHCKKVIAGERQRNDRICYRCILKRAKERYEQKKEQIKSSIYEYRKRNPELTKTKKKEDYLKHRERILAQTKRNYQEHRLERIAQKKLYRARTPEKTRARNHNRKVKIRAMSKESDITNKYLEELLQHANQCPLCKNDYANRQQKHIDHITPLHIGGKHTKLNVRVICRNCNLSRPKDGRDLRVIV